MANLGRKSALGVLLGLALLVSVASAQESPTVTIQNQSLEPVLTRIAGPTSGFVSIPAGGSRTIQVRGGRYLALFRYGDRRYSYTKIGPFNVVEAPTEISVITIVLHSYGGNTNEEPSSEKEFAGQ